MEEFGSRARFAWIRAESERSWRTYRTRSFSWYRRGARAGTDWQQGSRWTEPFTEPELEQLAQHLGWPLPRAFRSFLCELHRLDRPRTGARFSEEGDLVPHAEEAFYDWRERELIPRSRRQVAEGVIFDVERNDLWLAEWGLRPASSSERSAAVERWLASLPPLLPISGHRFLVATEEGPVVSLWQSEPVLIAKTLAEFVAAEIGLTLAQTTHTNSSPSLASLGGWEGLVR